MNLRTVDKFLKKLPLELHYIYGEHLGRAAVFPTRTASHCIPLFWLPSLREPPPRRWCNTCQVYYMGDLIQHRRTQDHKV